MDCCNTLLAASRLSTINKLQRVLNATIKVIYGGNKYDDFTPLIRDKLHWLRIPERIIYKLYANIYGNTQTGTAVHRELLSACGFGGVEKRFTIAHMVDGLRTTYTRLIQRDPA